LKLRYKLILRKSDVIQDSSKEIGTLNLETGGSYTVVFATKYEGNQTDRVENEVETLQYAVTQPNSLHMLWLLPQYVIITVGEVMFSVTGLEFSYSQVRL